MVDDVGGDESGEFRGWYRRRCTNSRSGIAGFRIEFNPGLQRATSEV